MKKLLVGLVTVLHLIPHPFGVSPIGGNYFIGPLPSGDYVVGINRADGYIREYFDNLSVLEYPPGSATPVTVGPSDAEDIDFALEQNTRVQLNWQARVTSENGSVLNVAVGDSSSVGRWSTSLAPGLRFSVPKASNST